MEEWFEQCSVINLDRRNTGSVKWNKYQQSDVLPFWVADMDFRSDPEILTALQKRVQHGVFGYTEPSEMLIKLIIDRFSTRYNLPIQADWLDWTHGLVSALNIVTRSYAKLGESVAVPYPIYPPFLNAPELAGCQKVYLPWIIDHDRWVIDFVEFEKKLTADTNLLLLCNPQNPNGRVLTRVELEKIESLSRQYEFIVCSDEVHCDLILDPECVHIPYASISDYAREHSVTLMSPSKTFNLAGLGCAFVLIPNDELRHRFQKVRSGIVPSCDSMIMGFAATEVAYQYSENWRQALLSYLRRNYQLLLEVVSSLNGVFMLPLEATYLAWINVSQLNLEDPQKFFEDQGIGLSSGALFGDRNYVRFNFACSKELLMRGLERFSKSIQALHK